jgi:hypothetical protein
MNFGVIGFSRTLMAMEMAGGKIRAAAVRRSGGRFEIMDFAALTLPEPDEDLPTVEIIRALAERLQPSGGDAVFVTPIARTFDLTMDRAKVAGLRPYQLKAAVKWEVEPYTGISGGNALVGVERARKPAAGAGDLEVEDEEAPVTVSVSAMERNIYRALKARFKAAGYRLLRIYPPDVTFYMPLLMEKTDTPRAIL